MAFLCSLDEPAQVLIAGASRGIGAALVERLLRMPEVGCVHAVARSWSDQQGAGERLHHYAVDLTEPAQLQTLVDKLQASTPRLHLVINCAGFLHQPDGQQPEKALQQIELAALEHSFRINAFAPILLAQALLPMLRGKHRCSFASLSARVGSIGDNHLGGWYAYRASKAAQNMLLRTFAIEWRRMNRNGCCLLLHPGTTDTDLSKPFQGRVPEGKLFTADFVAERLLAVIAEHGPQDSGQFYAWDGQPIPW
ncbi:MAG: SDR family NAD(P)-dependent oxidoreductase [Pseudomonadaceae bacterium]|nr:MAG: SDR family NAD(P)-dependent oxidoreductase [Pseudomonadaceae bacterium]